MTRDTDLRTRVLEELRLEPGLDSSGIQIAARGGVVTLTGSVPSHAASSLADRAAKRVDGVEYVIDELQLTVRPSSSPVSPPV